MDEETKIEFNKIREEQKTWFSNMEQLLVKHADTPPTSISGFMQEIQDKLGNIDKRLKPIESWQIELKTERKVLNWIWGAIGSFVLVAFFTGVATYFRLPIIIQEQVKSVMDERDKHFESNVLNVLDKHDRFQIITPNNYE